MNSLTFSSDFLISHGAYFYGYIGKRSVKYSNHTLEEQNPISKNKA